MPKFANSMLLIGDDKRWEIHYVKENGSHETSLIDAPTEEEARDFIKDKYKDCRIEYCYMVGQ